MTDEVSDRADQQKIQIAITLDFLETCLHHLLHPALAPQLIALKNRLGIAEATPDNPNLSCLQLMIQHRQIGSLLHLIGDLVPVRVLTHRTHFPRQALPAGTR